jgi:hypothetical protein
LQDLAPFVIGADVIGEGRDWIVPRVEEALPLEHLQRSEIVTLTGQTVMFELVTDPFQIVRITVKSCSIEQAVPISDIARSRSAQDPSRCSRSHSVQLANEIA